jgi:hypothetical protein
MTDQLIHLSEYDQAWPNLFAQQQAQVAAVVTRWLASRSST